MRKIFFVLLTLFLTAPVNAAKASNVSLSQVVLRGLDKVTGRLSTMTADVGTQTQFGALDVYVRVCYARPPEEVPENASFLEIVEKKPEGEAKVFSGWMFSSSPALSAMEHPVYDVWVLKCQGTPFKAPIPEPLVLKNPVQSTAPISKLKILQEERTEKDVVSEDGPPEDSAAASDANAAEREENAEQKAEGEGEDTTEAADETPVADDGQDSPAQTEEIVIQQDEAADETDETAIVDIPEE